MDYIFVGMHALQNLLSDVSRTSNILDCVQVSLEMAA